MLCAELTSLVIPTYCMGAEDPFAPLTFGTAARRDGRKVRPYPYPMQDDIDLATMPLDPERRHRVLRLNNGLLEALILPDLNGRLYSLRDLRSGRELFYRNHVVKPALVALRGAWLSGGIEFNFPTLGHSVSTVSPVFWHLQHTDTCVAAVLSDIDRTTRQRWEVRLVLRAGRAALDVEVRFSNPNPYRERLYYWENAAVPASDDMRFVCHCNWTVGSTSLPFPQRDGIDRSLHVNNPHPLDHFGYRSQADFFGAYYQKQSQGTYHVAPRLDLAGQKYFTWGTQADNQIWEDYLTDTDGQYVEIQAGLLETQWVTDWLHPHETLHAAGSWFGTEDMPELTWATPRLAAALTPSNDHPQLTVLSLDVEGPVEVRVASQDAAATTQWDTLQPGCTTTFQAPAQTPFTIEMRRPNGDLLLAERWTPQTGAQQESLTMRHAAEPPIQWAMNGRTRPAYRQAETEEKYHRWTDMEQALAACRDTTPASILTLLEARRDLKTGQAATAYTHAASGLQHDPLHPELHALAGAAAIRQYRITAETQWYDRVWDHALAMRRDPACTALAWHLLAEAAALAGKWLDARESMKRFITICPGTYDGPALLAAVTRACGEHDAATVLADSLQATPVHATLTAWLQGHPDVPLPELPGEGLAKGGHAVHRVELLLEHLFPYWRMGLLSDLEVLLTASRQQVPDLENHPVFWLLLADCRQETGADDAVLDALQQAAKAPVDWVFPGRWEEKVLLERALARLTPQKAPGLDLIHGLLLCETSQLQDGIAALKRVLTTPGVDPTPRALAARALADHALGMDNDPQNAAAWLQTALKERPGDRRLMCLCDDCLALCHDIRDRQALWKTLPAELASRGDVVFRLARLDLDRGESMACVEALQRGTFSVYEGGTSVRRLYVDACLVTALEKLQAGHPDAAASLLRLIFEYPSNLGAASYLGEHSRLARFLLGLSEWRAGRGAEAKAHWEDVLQRSGGSSAYSIGGEAGTTSGREDERLAGFLAACRLGRPPAPDAALPDPATIPDAQQAVPAMCDALRQGAAGAAALGDTLLERFPCSALLRILVRLARLDPLTA